jgi:ubiquitin C-terminal hydrolase
MLPGSLDTLLQMLDQYIAQAFWRSNSYQDWNIMQVSQQKSRSEFVGLKNLGCICYMNSLMQQLYTLPNFRDSIMQVTLEPKPSSVLYQFQLLLSALRSSQK